MIIMGLDTETTGLPQYGKDNPADGADQPRICSIAAGLYELDAEAPLDLLTTHIVPDGWTIGADLTAIHGLTDAICAAEGKPAPEVLAHLNLMMDRADMIVGHNISFDQKLLRGELRRYGLADRYGEHPSFCTMWLCRKAFTLKKPPKLAEAVSLALNVDHVADHKALTDMQAAVRIYFAIRDRVPMPTVKCPWIRDKSIPVPADAQSEEAA